MVSCLLTVAHPLCSLKEAGLGAQGAERLALELATAPSLSELECAVRVVVVGWTTIPICRISVTLTSLTAQPLEKRPREQRDQLLWADCRGCQPADKHCAPHDPVCRAISSDSLGTTVLIACFLCVCVQIR